MEAVIVKNNEFQTIGFEVTEGQTTLLGWGICPQKTNWTKGVHMDNALIQKVFRIIHLKGRIEERNNFMSAFFKVSVVAFPKEKQSVNFQEYEKLTDQLTREIESIIKTIV